MAWSFPEESAGLQRLQPIDISYEMTESQYPLVILLLVYLLLQQLCCPLHTGVNLLHQSGHCDQINQS